MVTICNVLKNLMYLDIFVLSKMILLQHAFYATTVYVACIYIIIGIDLCTLYQNVIFITCVLFDCCIYVARIYTNMYIVYTLMQNYKRTSNIFTLVQKVKVSHVVFLFL